MASQISAFIVTELTSGISPDRRHALSRSNQESDLLSSKTLGSPLKGILTMHAGASEGTDGDSAIHAGLSGTGKTTLSNTGYPVADDQIVVEIDSPNPDEVISNMEGGQYAKTENLLRRKSLKPSTLLSTARPQKTLRTTMTAIADYANTTITANGRVGYPLDVCADSQSIRPHRCPLQNITFFTADGFGVLPPVAKLTVESGMFHFACGFTSKMPGTEKGIDEPKPTFSAFFGKPFMPLKPEIYMGLLRKLVETHGTNIWLVNTGWLGPNHPGRSRVDITTSKAIINAVRDGKVDLSEDNFGMSQHLSSTFPKLCRALKRIYSTPDKPGRMNKTSRLRQTSWRIFSKTH